VSREWVMWRREPVVGWGGAIVGCRAGALRLLRPTLDTGYTFVEGPELAGPGLWERRGWMDLESGGCI